MQLPNHPLPTLPLSARRSHLCSDTKLGSGLPALTESVPGSPGSVRTRIFIPDVSPLMFL